MNEFTRRSALAALTLGLGLGGRLPAGLSPCLAGEGPEPADGWRPLFNGKDLSGWTFRNPGAKKVWVVCDDVKLDPADPTRLLPVGNGGGPGAVMLCGGDGRGSDIMTAESFADYELHLEFTVPQGSNSGVYNRGLFEIQVFDSYGAGRLAFHDGGALYERAIPPENLARPPGVWHSFDITLVGKKLTPALERQDGLQGPRHPLRRDRPRGVRAAHQGEPPASRPSCGSISARRRASSSATSARGGPAPAWTAPTRPGPILLQATTGRSPTGTCGSGRSGRRGAKQLVLVVLVSIGLGQRLVL